MLRRLRSLAPYTVTVFLLFLLSASNAAAIPVPFDIAGPGQANVDTDPGTEVDLTALLSGTILDLNVAVVITGDHMEDLDLFLTSPAGTTVQFRRDFYPQAQGPMLAATFDDQALAPHDAQQVNTSVIGTFQPFQTLSVFNGQQLAGIWTLIILDDTGFEGDGDELVSWRITGVVETNEVPEPATLGLLAGGLGWLAMRRRTRRLVMTS